MKLISTKFAEKCLYISLCGVLPTNIFPNTYEEIVLKSRS